MINIITIRYITSLCNYAIRKLSFFIVGVDVNEGGGANFLVQRKAVEHFLWAYCLYPYNFCNMSGMSIEPYFHPTNGPLRVLVITPT